MTELALNHYICPEGYGIDRFLDDAARLGVSTIGLTRTALEEKSPASMRKALCARNMTVTTLNSAGYFTYAEPAARRKQIDENSVLLEVAGELEARTLTVITGGIAECPSVGDARQQVQDGLAQLDAQAAAAGVTLGA